MLEETQSEVGSVCEEILSEEELAPVPPPRVVSGAQLRQQRAPAKDRQQQRRAAAKQRRSEAQGKEPASLPAAKRSAGCSRAGQRSEAQGEEPASLPASKRSAKHPRKGQRGEAQGEEPASLPAAPSLTGKDVRNFFSRPSRQQRGRGTQEDESAVVLFEPTRRTSSQTKKARQARARLTRAKKSVKAVESTRPPSTTTPRPR